MFLLSFAGAYAGAAVASVEGGLVLLALLLAYEFGVVIEYGE